MIEIILIIVAIIVTLIIALVTEAIPFPSIWTIIVTLIIALGTFYLQWKIQKDILFMEIIKQELNIWDLNEDNKKQIGMRNTKILNFFERVAYLVLKKKIDEQMTKDIFKSKIKDFFILEHFKKILCEREGTEFEHLIKLAVRWGVKNTEKFKKEENL